MFPDVNDRNAVRLGLSPSVTNVDADVVAVWYGPSEVGKDFLISVSAR